MSPLTPGSPMVAVSRARAWVDTDASMVQAAAEWVPFQFRGAWLPEHTQVHLDTECLTVKQKNRQHAVSSIVCG